MTKTTSVADLDVERDLAISDAVLVPVTFREPLPRKTAPHRFSERLVPTLGIALLLIAAAAAYGRFYRVVRRFLESTDDAYVQADSTIGALGNIVREQAMIMAYADTFAVLGVLLLLAAGLLLFTQRGQASGAVAH